VGGCDVGVVFGREKCVKRAESTLARLDVSSLVSRLQAKPAFNPTSSLSRLQ